MVMKISLLTDEISADPETAIELGVEWGVRDFELRGFYNDRVPRLSDYQRHHLGQVLNEHQARIIAVGPGLFKIPNPPKHPPRTNLGWLDHIEYGHWSEAQRLVRYHLDELLPASLEYAREFGAQLVVIFGFDRAGAPPGDPPEQVLDCLWQAAEQAKALEVQLVLENEAGFWADTGRRTARMVRVINHPALSVNWDPGNAFFAGDDPYPTGYEEVRGLVRHVHFKDARRDRNGEAQFVAEGQIDWERQVQALAADGFNGYLSIETHIRPKVAAARAALERLRALIANTMENGQHHHTKY